MIAVGDTFTAPLDPLGRFPGREMRVRAIFIIEGVGWVDAEPVEPRPDDRYFHCTYRIGPDDQPLPVALSGGSALPTMADDEPYAT
jgi:hypothetical protein